MSYIDNIKNLAKNLGPKYGFADPKSATMWTTPWAWRDDEGLYVGHDRNEVWLYRAFPGNPLDWEEAPSRIQLGNELQKLFIDLEAESKSSMDNFLNNRRYAESRYREVHLTTTTWEAIPEVPKGTSPRLASYITESTEGFTFPNRVLLVGVKLRASFTSLNSQRGMLTQLADTFTSMLGEATPDLERYDEDKQLVTAIMARYGAKKPTKEHLRQLESWYNLGRGPDVEIIEEASRLLIDRSDSIELAAVMKFNDPIMTSPMSQWIADAMAQNDGPSCISIRAKLEPGQISRQRSRSSQRKIRATLEEEAATGDLERSEYQSTKMLAKELEDFFVSTNEPLFTNTSFIMARRTTASNETYMDFLRNFYSIEVRPLDHRQLDALDETLPCSNKRVNPFLQDVTIGMVSFAGMHAFDALGDNKGNFVGFTRTDLVPVFIDPRGASIANTSPTTVIVGEPGSGKTFLAQLMAIQSAIAGEQVIFINPKAADKLDGLEDIEELEGKVETIHMSALEGEPGAFDPFRFAPPRLAAELLGIHILSVLDLKDDRKALALEVGIQEGAAAGAQCAMDALSHVKDKELVKLVLDQVKASAVFSLGFSLTPKPKFNDLKGLTVIEFDRKLDLPDPNKEASSYTRNEKIALAAMRLVTRASIEILTSAGGGTLVVDEAWTFLSHPSGRAAIQALGREGRSQEVWPILATQRLDDILREDMEGYISRAFIMKLTEPKEAKAAYKLIGINDPTESQIAFLRNAGPKRATEETSGQPAIALHRDLTGRKAPVYIGPTPERIALAISTNPEDRKLRRALKEERKRQG